MSVTVSGTVPSTIFENARPGDWQAVLRLNFPAWEVVLTGPAAALFQVEHRAGSRDLIVTSAAALDAETLADPMLRFGVSVRGNSGWRDAQGEVAVVLVGVDDTPPQALRFASGGTVLANDVGAAIGTLAADDPDTVTPLEYRVAWPDSAFFEIEGDTLRLRPGVDLVAHAGGRRDVLIEASDGLNTSAFTLTVEVLPPGDVSLLPTDGDAGPNTMAGTAQPDWLIGHGGADSLAGLDGADLLDGGSGRDSLDGGAGGDTLEGGAEGDLLLGGEGNDLLRGGEEADTLAGGAGADRLEGGVGDDSYLWDPADTILESPDGGTDELVVTGAATLPVGIERLRLRDGAGDLALAGGAGADLLAGNDGRNLLSGLGGDDGLDGAAGADTLRGGEGADRLSGGAEADLVEGGEGGDLGFGDAGADSLLGGGGDDTLLGGEGADRLEGGAGLDLLLGGAGDDLLVASGRDRLDGGEGNDLLRSGAEDGAELRGGAGADTLDAAAGTGWALAAGGAGDDVVLVDHPRDRVVEIPGGGLDTVRASIAGGGFALPGFVENLVLTGTTAWGRGNAEANRLTGNAGANLLSGAAGNDTLEGRDGSDTLLGGAGADLFLLAAGPDRDRLRDFTPGEDRLLLSGTGLSDPAAVVAALQAVTGGVLLPVTGGGSILFEGLAPGAIAARDILLG